MNSSTSPSSQPPQPAIPVAMQYARADESIILVKLVRTIGVILLALGAIRISIDPFISLRASGYRAGGGTSLYVANVIVSFFGHIIVDVLAICGGIACQRRLRSAAKLLVAWAVGSLALGVALLLFSIVSISIYGAGTLSFVGLYQITYIGNSIANFAAGAGLPIVCLVLLSFPDARRVLSRGGNCSRLTRQSSSQ